MQGGWSIRRAFPTPRNQTSEKQRSGQLAGRSGRAPCSLQGGPPAAPSSGRQFGAARRMLCPGAVLDLVPDPPPNRDWSHYLLPIGVVLLLVPALWVGAARSHDPLQALPAAQARAIYESNLNNFATSCHVAFAHEAGALANFCRREASLLRDLADCDAQCQQATASFVSAEASR